MEKEYRISEKYLDEIVRKTANSLCGIAMKRFEILEDKKAIKASIKEIIYENFRVLKELIKSYNRGVIFKTEKPEK